MGNIGTTIKRFFSNKNTVTLLAIVVCTGVLYFAYDRRVKGQVQTARACYAVETIPARAEITWDMVGEMRVLSSQISSNMVTDCNSVVGKYASYATEVPQNSYFYESMLMTEEEMPDSSFSDIQDGFTLYNFPVSFESTYGNSIFPGNYIDLYMKTQTEAGQLVYGKFIQSIKVYGVKDSQGQNVFETTVETRMPSQLLFSVPEDLYLLLKKAEYLGIEIVIVPRNNNYTAQKGETLVSSEYLRNLIENQTYDIPDECKGDKTGIAECNAGTTTNTTTNTDTNTNTQNTTETAQ